jgi:predicted transglutaminase-like cysteine proteinase
MRGRYSFFFVLILALPPLGADARNKPDNDAIAREPIVETSPALAPFQHVRFCLRYPQDCQANSTKNRPIKPQMMELLIGVNHRVNRLINPRSKAYDDSPYESWTIAPEMGDCNDYAVTKRHELLMRGLPSSALRLSVAKTADGVGHLVLVVTTTVGNLVMDNLTDKIMPWQMTDYRWIKVQSTNDPHLWIGIKQPVVGAYAERAAKP